MRRGKVPQKYIWEGKILNKISKKIVALVTMAAFVLTLVPFAAFAAGPNDPVVSASTYEVASDAAGELKVTVHLNQAVDTPATTFSDKVYVSIVNGQGQAPSAGTINVSGISDSASDYSGLSSTGVTPNSATVTVTVSDVPADEYTAVVYYGGVDSADKRLAPVDGQKVTVHDDSAYADNSAVEVDSITTSGFAVKVNLKDYFKNDADVSSNNNVKVEVAGINSTATVALRNASGASTVNALASTGATVSNAASTYTFSNVKADTYNVTVKVNDVQIGQAIAVTVPEAASETSSRLLIDGSYKDVTVDPETTKQVAFNVLENNGAASAQALTNVYIWAENEQGKLVDGVTFSQDAAKGDLAVTQSRNGYIWSVGTVENGDTVTANFDLPGTYYIYAGVSTGLPTAGTTDVDAAFANVDLLKAIKVTVNAKDFETNSIALFSDENLTTQIGTVTNDNNKVTWNINDEVTPNGVKVYTVYGVAYESANVPAEFETLNISCAKTGIQLLDSEVGTDANGEFSFRFTMTKDGSYPIKIAEADGDLAATLTVVQDNVTPLDITTTEQGGTMLAGNDATYASQVYDNNPGDENHVYFSDAVQFNITDINGKDASGAGIIANEAAADNTGANGTHADYLSVKAPTGSDLEADDLELAWDGTHYTIEYVGDDYQHDLIPGEYTVKVSLNNSKNATATFKLAKFGTVQEITTDLVAQDVNGLPNDNAITEIDDEVALGQLVTGTVSYVDENGIKVQADADDLNIGINGSNSASVVAKNEQANPFTFTLANNTAANESLIGTTVTIKVFDETHQKYVEKTLTIVKGYLAETLSFDPTEGPINEDNTVTVSVVDENDKLSKVNGTLSAYIEKQSNADATVYLDVADNAVNDGKGELTLYSDQEGTVDVVVVVKADNGEMYGKTLTYTFGAVDPAAQNTVVMTIGSTEYVVNNDIIAGDAAPYVDGNWRTMVPFRVLGETFGATVDWDQENQTVTYTYGNTTLTMTIGSTTYTVNGADKTMDTAPVLSGDRTFVPVRFVAEALGYEVTPLQDSTGLTASVVFQK